MLEEAVALVLSVAGAMLLGDALAQAFQYFPFESITFKFLLGVALATAAIYIRRRRFRVKPEMGLFLSLAGLACPINPLGAFLLLVGVSLLLSKITPVLSLVSLPLASFLMFPLPIPGSWPATFMGLAGAMVVGWER